MTKQIIERRTSVRVPLGLTVDIAYPPLVENNHLQSTACNISFDGAFITDTAKCLDEDTLVRVEVAGDGGTYLIDGIVLRRDESGAAILFADYGDEALRLLASLLDAKVDGSPPLRRLVADDMVQY